MNDNIFDIEESDLDLGFDPSFLNENEQGETEEATKETKLQRTKDWNQQRLGNWNASEIKKLQSCEQKYAKVSWHSAEKHLAFSPGALKYIYKKAKERETGRGIETSQTAQMKYGTVIEDFTFKRATPILKELGLELQRVGYKPFPDIPTAGASSDGITVKIDTGEIYSSVEMKACTSWETMYERTFENTDEKSLDFWQTQQQMLAWDVKFNYYIVISPPADIKKYIYADDIEPLYDEWLNETELSLELIERSDIHCAALKKRISIAEKTITEFIETKENIKNIFHRIIDEEKGVLHTDVKNAPKLLEADVDTDEMSEFELEQQNNISEEKEAQPETVIQQQAQNAEKFIEKPKSIEEIDDLPF